MDMSRRRLFAPPAGRTPVPIPAVADDILSQFPVEPNNGVLIKSAEVTRFQISSVCGLLKHPRILRGDLGAKITCLLLVEAPFHQLLMVKEANYLCLQFDGTKFTNMTTDIFEFSHVIPPPVEAVRGQWEIFQVGIVKGSLGEGPEKARIIDPSFMPLVNCTRFFLLKGIKCTEFVLLLLIFS